MTNTNVEANNDMLDFDIEELADMPSFEIPAGAYRLEGIKLGQTQDAERGTIINVEMKVIATTELVDATAKPMAEGAIIKFNWALTAMKKDGTINEFGTEANQGQIKYLTKPLAAALGTGGSFVALAQKFAGAQFDAIITLRKYKDKDGAERSQNNFKSPVVPV
jgi:hypothetical protein